MNADMNQIELTDQELEQVVGGADPFGIGFFSGGVTLTPGGAIAGGTGLGVGSGPHFGFGAAGDTAFADSFSGAGITNTFGSNTGFGLGAGF